jgi:hypothetical protein
VSKADGFWRAASISSASQWCSRHAQASAQPIEITIDLRRSTNEDVKGIPPGTTVVFRDYGIEGAAETDRDNKGQPCFILRWQHDTAVAETLFVKVEEINDDRVTLINERIAFDEMIGDDDIEKADALHELRHGRVTRIGGGASPLYRLTKLGRG